jgi:hypothetical protein
MDHDEIRKIVESCHLNFLIGSGASDPYFKLLGNVEEQLTSLANKVNSITKDQYSVIDASIKQYYFEQCIEGNLAVLSPATGVLLQIQSTYNKFLSSLNTILINRRSNLVSKQINIFTTNMDILLDYSLESQNLSFNDGFAGKLNTRFGTINFHNTIRKTSSHFDYHSEVPLFNLFKLHGSVNWKLDGDKISYDYGLTTLDEIKHSKIPPSEIIASINHPIDELIEDLRKSPIPLSSNHHKFLEAYNKLLMINPTKAKFAITTTDLNFYELLRMYSNHLERENSVLFVLGFSFADEHIREITKRVAASNPTLLIVIFCHSKSSKLSIQSKLAEFSNIKFISDDPDTIKYDLPTINEMYFIKLAEELAKSYQHH